MALRRCTRRTMSRSVERVPQLFGRDLEGRCYPAFHVRSETTFSAFDATDRCGTHARNTAEQRLREAADDAPVTGVAVVGCDIDDVFNRLTQLIQDTHEHINLGTADPFFPPSDRGLGDIGKATQLVARELGVRSGFDKPRSGETAHHAARHGASRRGIGMVDITGHDAPQRLGLAHWLIMSADQNDQTSSHAQLTRRKTQGGVAGN